MTEEYKKAVINSWNEWDPLKHVIVGRTEGNMVQAPEPAIDRDVPDWGFPLGAWGPMPDKLSQKAKAQMDAFVDSLEQRGIRVDRPTPLDFAQIVQTPDWVQDSMSGCMPPRDVLVCVGNEILEATMSLRSRWYEYLCYRPLLEEYFKDDPNFVWESAPKPRLGTDTYVKDYWDKQRNEWSDHEKEERMHARKWVLTEKEPLFDAADIMRFGKDLFVQASSVTNGAGISWLRRHFESKGLRLHVVTFEGEYNPVHIDCSFFAPRPGLLMQGPKYLPLTPEFHELFRKNGWEVVMAEPSSRAEGHPIEWDTRSLAYNVLSLDPETICVEAEETLLMDQLDELKLDVIPVDFHEVAPFGGGLHCATVDVFREGECEDYFPNQIEGF